MDRLYRGFYPQWLIVLLCIVAVSCCHNKAVNMPETRLYAVELSGVMMPYSYIGRVHGMRLLVDKDVDMNGALCQLPKGMTLCFKGGVIRNGALVGHDTRVEGRGMMFDRVLIQGSWNVPKISTKMFADLTYENALRDVVALASPKVQNRITIEKGDYWVKMEKNGDVGLSLCNQTELVLKGSIRLVPNDYKNYYIVRVTGEDVRIVGGGTIVGDKPTHTGTDGEWGMGIELRGAVNATVKGLTIKDCWGDCIYVGDSSRKVLIEECTLANGRRQGISITSADGVIIRKCNIYEIAGTAPEYAIDVEPNQGDSVDNIDINKIKVTNCKGAFLANGHAINASIGKIVIKDCTSSTTPKIPIRLMKVKEAFVGGCDIRATNDNYTISCDSIDNVTIRNNIMRCDVSWFNKIFKIGRHTVNDRLQIINCIKNTVVNNSIIAQ